MTTTYEAELELRCEALEEEVSKLSIELESYKDGGSFHDIIKNYTKILDKKSVKKEQKKIFNFLVGIMGPSQAKSWEHYEFCNPAGRVVNANDPDFKNTDYDLMIICFNNRVELRYGASYSGIITFKRSFITRSLFPTMGDKLYKLAAMMMKSKREPPDIVKKIDEITNAA